VSFFLLNTITPGMAGFNLEAAIQFPAKHAKHAKTKAAMKVREGLWLHLAGER